MRGQDPHHEPTTRLVCVENTHNSLGGKVLPIDWLKEVRFLLPNIFYIVKINSIRVVSFKYFFFSSSQFSLFGFLRVILIILDI